MFRATVIKIANTFKSIIFDAANFTELACERFQTTESCFFIRFFVFIPPFAWPNVTQKRESCLV